MAFGSSQTGNPEVYLTDFPNAAVRTRLSTAGGSQPRWRRDGRELFYIDRAGTLMSVELSAAGQISQTPQTALRSQLAARERRVLYGVSADGQRFLEIEGIEQPHESDIDMILNWPSLLRR